uniref:Ubiquinol oxidase n=1 Tax=Amphora coffeiformis TaxID=265554 RepID=A0A7S3L0V3_9STRA|mmetsp:Transcript_26674/g.50329  ORF Transcript_26674/g.50329 Transcript_26674/m.50329 type:complete len:389 (-) Transcript_26674:50-1216(-)
MTRIICLLVVLAKSHAFVTWRPQTVCRSNRLPFRRIIADESRVPSDARQGSPSQQEEVDFYIELTQHKKFDGTKPDSSWNLALSNFARQSKTIGEEILQMTGIVKQDPLLPPQVLGLTLSNKSVAQTEAKRIAAGDGVDAHPVSMAMYKLGCSILDTVFEERPIQRFWFLEVVARIPYFSYVSMLHLYESLGWWRCVELRKVHAAEEWNELHHLLIMESLGGNLLWSDRFLAYHAAILYYWLLILVFLGSPRIAYQFMELLEAHAVDTYTTFCRQNKQRLQQLPAPSVAKSYYASGDLYLFDDFQISRPPGSRRPPCDNLYDVFMNIAADEGEHVKTMAACQEYALSGTRVVSPHLNYAAGSASVEDKRQMWKEWSEQMNPPSEMEGF